MIIIIITSVQSNLAKGRIADLSPPAAANGLVRTWPHVIHGSLGPHESAPKTASRSVQPFLYSSISVWPNTTQTHRPRDVWHLSHTMRLNINSNINSNNNKTLITTRWKVLWESTNPRESVFVVNTRQHLPHLLFCGPLVPNFPTKKLVNNRRFTEFFWPLLPHPYTDRNETRTWTSLSP